MAFAFRPYAAFMLCGDGFSDGESEAEAAISGPCLINAVKSLKKLVQIFGAIFRPLRLLLQAGDVLCRVLQAHPCGSFRTGIFLGIVQQDIQNLPQFGRVAGHRDIFCDLSMQRESLLKKYRLKGKDRVKDKPAEIYRGKAACPDTVGSGELQHLLHQTAHLP